MFHSRKTRVLVDEFDLSGFLTNVAPRFAVDTDDITPYRKDAKVYLPGHVSGGAGLSGIWSGAVDEVDEILEAALGDETGQIVSVSVQGIEAVGDRAVLLKAQHTSYEVTSPNTGAVRINADVTCDDGPHGGVALKPLVQENAGNSAASVDHGAATADGAVAHLHVTQIAGTGPTLDVKIEHSTDGNSWSDLLTFSQVGAVGAQRVVVSGTVNRHVRATWTIGGVGTTATFAVTMARR